MHNFVHEMLHNSPAAQRIHSLWQEYEAGETPEAKFVKGGYLLRLLVVRTIHTDDLPRPRPIRNGVAR